MGELKGQLLSLLTVLVIFGAIAGSLYAAFNTTKDKIYEEERGLEKIILLLKRKMMKNLN